MMNLWVGRLIFANVLMFIASIAFPRLPSLLAFVPALALQRPWTLITYMFLHGGMMHILFNMIALFFFGPRLEARLGAKRFLWLYFVSGITGAVLSALVQPYAAIIGASGAVFGVLLGFAYYWPRDRIYIWGILPIEARWLVVILTLFSLYSGLPGSGAGANVAHFAHLGGFLGGFLYIKWIERRPEAKKFKRQVEGPGPRMGDRQIMAQWSRIRPEDLHEVNREQYERLAAKIQAEGVGSLTPRERMFIERFSRG
jgi:membrane associated rhomboid family serine protease